MKKEKLPKGIRQRPNGRFIVDVTVNNTRKTAVVRTLEDAITIRQELTSQLELSTTPASKQREGWTLQDTFDRTLSNTWIGTGGEAAAKRNGEAALRYFGKDMGVTQITTAGIDAYVDSLVKINNSDATINRKLSALSTMLKTAYDRGQLSILPRMPRRKEREGRIRFLSSDEEIELLKWFNHVEKPDHLEATIVLLDTGFRCSELWGIEAEHINPHNKTITIWKTKNGKPRTIPMTERVLAIISRRCKENPKGQLFPGSSNDWYGNGWERVRTLMKKLDDTEFVPHMLRHTCCSRLVQRGVPLAHVQAWMGHKNIQTTMRYAHLAPHDLFSLAQVLEGDGATRWQHIQNDNLLIQ